MNLFTPAHPLSGYGWDDGWEAAFAPHTERGLLPARVVRVDRGLCSAVVADGDTTAVLRAETTDVASPDPVLTVCTGDWIAVEPGGGTGPEPGHAARALLPRRTAFVRSTSSKRTDGQVLATNIDHIVLCVPLAAELDLGKLERLLALAASSSSGDGHAEPLVVLTKTDLVDEPDVLGHLVGDVEATAPGVQVLPVSAATGEGLDVLTAVVAGGTAVLLGQSGAGKSTLTNALLDEEIQEVRAIRDSDGKGRHTTTTRDLLPLPAGGALIDTPGLRGVGLWDAAEGLGRAFSEIEALAEGCRFHDCAHRTEPGCAVLAAIEEGSLAERRLDSYRKLLRENERIAARTDAKLRAEQRQMFKQRQALGRHMMERKRGPMRGR